MDYDKLHRKYLKIDSFKIVQNKLFWNQSMKNKQQHMDDRKNKINDDIDCSLQQTLKMTQQTANVGANTAETLDQQRNQIRNIHQNLHKTDAHLNDSEFSLQTVEHWVGGVVNWVRGNQPRKQRKYYGMKHDKKRKKDNKQLTINRNHKQNDDKIMTSTTRKKKQREKLKQVNNQLDILYAQANDIGNEIEIQNKMITECQHKMNDLDQNFQKKNKRLNKLLKK
eukprot:66251_1